MVSTLSKEQMVKKITTEFSEWIQKSCDALIKRYNKWRSKNTKRNPNEFLYDADEIIGAVIECKLEPAHPKSKLHLVCILVHQDLKIIIDAIFNTRKSSVDSITYKATTADEEDRMRYAGYLGD